MLAARSRARPRPSTRVPLATAALCALLGCAPSANAPPAGAHAPRSLRLDTGAFEREPRTLSAAEALRDLDDARHAFAEAYAAPDGRPPVPEPRALARAEAAIRARAAWRPDDFARLLRDLFAAADSHLAFGYGGRAPLRLAAAIGEMPPPAQALYRTDAAHSPVSLTHLGGVPVLAIRTFGSAAAPLLERLPALAGELRRTPGFVVDLRGNSGGNYAFAEAFVLALTDAPLRRLDEREVVSVAAAEGRANSARRRLARGDVPAAAVPRFLAHIDALERLAATLRAQRARRAEIVTRGEVVRGRAPGPLAGRAVLLVDRGCASACEMMLALARQIPGVLVAGQNTHGGMSVGEVALFQLPRSGVTICLGTRAFRDPLGDFAETRGFSPDIRLDGGDLLAAAAALARREPSPGRVAQRLL